MEPTASQTSAKGWSELTGKRHVYWDAFLQAPNFLKMLKKQISSEATTGEENPCDVRRVDSIGSDGNKSFRVNEVEKLQNPLEKWEPEATPGRS